MPGYRSHANYHDSSPRPDNIWPNPNLPLFRTLPVIFGMPKFIIFTCHRMGFFFDSMLKLRVRFFSRGSEMKCGNKKRESIAHFDTQNRSLKGLTLEYNNTKQNLKIHKT